MENVLTQSELLTELNNFKYNLQNFDYSNIKNITFINLDALYYYIENIEDNPFKIQYEKLQKILDIIEPYIPFSIDSDIIDILDITSISSNDEESHMIKNFFSLKKRINFMNSVRIITTDEQWQYLIDTCEKIRNIKISEIKATV